jgi:hypothetical protein
MLLCGMWTMLALCMCHSWCELAGVSYAAAGVSVHMCLKVLVYEALRY